MWTSYKIRKKLKKCLEGQWNRLRSFECHFLVFLVIFEMLSLSARCKSGMH